MSPDHLTPGARRVYHLLVAAADAGQRAPSNAQVAAVLGIGSAGHASEAISRLERAGLIRVDRGSCTRKITIVATGASTAGEIPAPHWRDRDAPPQPKPQPRRYRRPVDAQRDEGLAARIEADQARLTPARLAWLELERQRYRLPRRGRLPEEMAA